MSIDLNPVLEKAFFIEEVENASEALARAEHTWRESRPQQSPDRNRTARRSRALRGDVSAPYT